YLIFYPVLRFTLEFLRLDSSEITSALLNLSINANQSLSAVLAIVAAIWYSTRHRAVRRHQLKTQAAGEVTRLWLCFIGWRGAGGPGGVGLFSPAPPLPCFPVAITSGHDRSTASLQTIRLLPGRGRRQLPRRIGRGDGAAGSERRRQDHHGAHAHLHPQT